VMLPPPTPVATDATAVAVPRATNRAVMLPPPTMVAKDAAAVAVPRATNGAVMLPPPTTVANDVAAVAVPRAMKGATMLHPPRMVVQDVAAVILPRTNPGPRMLQTPPQVTLRCMVGAVLQHIHVSPPLIAIRSAAAPIVPRTMTDTRVTPGQPIHAIRGVLPCTLVVLPMLMMTNATGAVVPHPKPSTILVATANVPIHVVPPVRMASEEVALILLQGRFGVMSLHSVSAGAQSPAVKSQERQERRNCSLHDTIPLRTQSNFMRPPPLTTTTTQPAGVISDASMSLSLELTTPYAHTWDAHTWVRPCSLIGRSTNSKVWSVTRMEVKGAGLPLMI
jgi:hypothetical protein